MSNRLRARVAAHRPDACRLTELTEEAEVVSRGNGVELFTSSEHLSVDEAAELFEEAGTTVYRSEWSDEDCLCRVVESLGHPVADVTIEDGTLWLTLYLRGLDELRTALETLRNASEQIALERLQYDGGESSREDIRCVNVGRLTDRRREVLLTACRQGYFESPRETGIEGLAEQLDLAPSTIHEHLTAAQRTVFGELFVGR